MSLDKLYSRYNRIRQQIAREYYQFALQMISHDDAAIPAYQKEWGSGQTHSWHLVQITNYRVAQFIENLEELLMPRAKQKDRKNADFGAYVFIKCELREEDKKAAKVWVEENTAKLGEILHDVMAADYKFTCSFSPDHDTFTACLVGKEDNPINGKKTLTARHKDWVFASLTVLYKHQVMFREGVWISATSEDDDGWA